MAEASWPGEKAEQGAVLRWQALHDLTCWREHPVCAMARAKDVHLAQREHHAARARWFGEVLARHLQGLPERDDVAEALELARAVLEAAHAAVPPNRKRPRARREAS